MCVIALQGAGLCTPRVVVILADGIAFADVNNPGEASLSCLKSSGYLGLMSVGLPNGTSPVRTAYAVLGLGGAPQGVPGATFEQSLHMSGKQVDLLGDCNGDDTGTYTPQTNFIGLASGDSLLISAANPRAPGGKTTDATLVWKAVRTRLVNHDLVVVQWGDLVRLERERILGLVNPQSYQVHRANVIRELNKFAQIAAVNVNGREFPFPLTVWIVAPSPPLSHGRWNQLSVAWKINNTPGAGVPRDLTSATTHTPGLIASRDLAPTLLSELGIAIPTAMTGSDCFSTTATPQSRDFMGQIDRMASMTQKLQTPLFSVLGTISGLSAFVCLYVLVTKRVCARHTAVLLFLLRLTPGWMFALLLVPMFKPETQTALLAEIAVISLLLALIRSPELLYAACAAAVLTDAIFGSHNLSQSPLSAYPLTGIRFYGIGNEFMGLAIAGILIASSILRRALGSVPRNITVPITLFVVSTFILVYPSFGAKAGAAVTCGITFTAAIQRFRNKRISVWIPAIGVGLGLMMLFIATYLGRMLGAEPTHVDLSVHAVSSGNAGYILSIVSRKALMAIRVAIHPGTIIGGVALLSLVALIISASRNWIDTLSNADPSYVQMLQAGVVGCGACVLFNDSGVVAGILLLGALSITFLHRALEEKCAV